MIPPTQMGKRKMGNGEGSNTRQTPQPHDASIYSFRFAQYEKNTRTAVPHKNQTPARQPLHTRGDGSQASIISKSWLSPPPDSLVSSGFRRPTPVCCNQHRHGILGLRQLPPPTAGAQKQKNFQPRINGAGADGPGPQQPINEQTRSLSRRQQTIETSSIQVAETACIAPLGGGRVCGPARKSNGRAKRNGGRAEPRLGHYTRTSRGGVGRGFKADACTVILCRDRGHRPSEGLRFSREKRPPPPPLQKRETEGRALPHADS